MGLIKVHAFNNLVKRCKMWEYITINFVVDFNWVFSRDFSMVEVAKEKT